MKSQVSDQNIKYYDENSGKFSKDTLGLDMGSFYTPFLEKLPQGGAILDVGCGPGRDSHFFKQNGFQVESIDPARAFMEIARAEFQIEVKTMRIQDLESEQKFDGIWACASLLHVPHDEMNLVYQKLARALRPQGVLYCSYKYGQGETHRGDRKFSNFNEAGMRDFIKSSAVFKVHQIWKTADARPERSDEHWLNTLLIKA